MNPGEQQDQADWFEQQFELLAAGLVHDDLSERSRGNAFAMDSEYFDAMDALRQVIKLEVA